MATVCPGVVDLRQELVEVDPSPVLLHWRGEHGDQRVVGPDAGKFLADRSEVLMVERVVHGEGVDARVAVLEGSDEQEGVVKDGVGCREKVGLQGLKGLLVIGGKCGEDLDEGLCGVEGGVREARCKEAGDGVCGDMPAGAEDLDGSEIREVLDSRA